VKTAPHFGHLIFVSFPTDAHPKEKTAKIANAIKMFTHFLMTTYSFRQLISILMANLNLNVALNRKVDVLPKFYQAVLFYILGKTGEFT